jgi:3-phenylpropionate/trans-cinnamate dioxygenase ferredoxin reductase component
MSGRHCIIVGGGHAAAQLGPSLRQQGWDGDITLVTDEPVLPYQRPPLSKGYLSGSMSMDQLLIRSARAYDKAGILCKLGVRAERIDRQARQLHLSSGEVLDYSALALTVGARIRPLDVPGQHLEGVFYMRSVADLDRIQAYIGRRQPRHAVVVGGGYIGLETAAVLRKLGMAVTVLEAMPRLLQRVTTAEVAEFYRRVHMEEGVDIRCSQAASAITGDHAVSAVHCESGDVLRAELVIVGIGVIPNTLLASAAGLNTHHGILVDEFAQTNDPAIVAAGDCTEFYSALYGRAARLESVPHAVGQATSAAATLCGKPSAYHALPWFWSDQYDLKLQMAGLSQGHEQAVIRGSITTGRSVSVFYLSGGKLLAVDCINRPKDFILGRKLIEAQQVVDANRLADESFDLGTLLNAKGTAP